MIAEIQGNVNALEKKHIKTAKMIKATKGAAIRANKRGDREEARCLLKKIKGMQAENTATGNQLDGMNRQLDAVKQSKTNVMVFDGYKAGNEVMAASTAKMGVQEVDEVLDETGDHVISQSEISRALGGGAFTDPYDEDDLDAELNQMMEASEAVPVESGADAMRRRRAQEMIQEAEAMEATQGLPTAPSGDVNRNDGGGGGRGAETAALDTELDVLDTELEAMEREMNSTN